MALLKQKVIWVIIAIGVILIAIFQGGLYSPNLPQNDPKNPQNQEEQPNLVLTNPNPLNGVTILPTQIIELTFNKPLVNDPGKVVFSPNHEFRIELTNDNKTMRIIPVNPFILGTGYNLTILKDYGFDTGEKLPDNLNFSFKTINYSGV